MITRDIAQGFVVPAFWNNARFHSCTVAGYTCYKDGATSAIGTSEFFPGFVIDRLGLPGAFRSMGVAPLLFGDYGVSEPTNGTAIAATLSIGVMHASASGGTYAAYSTGSWMVSQPLWRQTTSTSTAAPLFSAVQRDVGNTSEIGTGGLTSTSTSTAAGASAVAGTSSTSFLYYAGPMADFAIDGAKRFIKVVIRPQFETTGCASGSFALSAVAPTILIPSFRQESTSRR